MILFVIKNLKLVFDSLSGTNSREHECGGLVAPSIHDENGCVKVDPWLPQR